MTLSLAYLLTLSVLHVINASLPPIPVVKAPKFTHTTPILKSLHWLKINQRIEYKILSITYKILTTAQPLIIDLPYIETRSSSSVILSRPSSFSLKITDRSFCYASPCLWIKLPASFRQPRLA